MPDDIPVMNYDEPGILEHDIGETTYRIDSGRQGTALALSTRPVGSWDWAFFAELRWDGIDLKCKQLDYETRRVLSAEFKRAIEDMD